MRKPSTCWGCPFAEVSSEWVPDELREQAPVMILGQNPGVEEIAEGRPFVGKTGRMMEATYLKDAGLTREDVSLSNTIRCRWGMSNDLPPLNSVVAKEAMAHCTREHLRIPEGTRVLVAQGDYAATVLTGEPVKEWRGYVRPYVGRPPIDAEEPWQPHHGDLPVLVTSHLAKLFREPDLILPTRMDWTKVPRLLRGTWPRKPPTFKLEPLETWPAMFAFDTEYYGDEPSPTLTRYSVAWGTEDDQATVVEAARHRTPSLLEGTRPRVITQYAPADVRYLARLSRVGRRVWEDFEIEDAVWKHAVLWADHAHDLNYLASLYSSFNRWKHLSEARPHLYSALDAIGLLEVDRALERELNADPRSRKVWEEIDRPALGEFVRAQYAGLRTDPERVGRAVTQLEGEVTEAGRMARAITGQGYFNVGSNPQVGKRLYQIEGWKEPR